MGILLFDLDGTLIDSRADLACSVNLLRADFGLPPLPLATVVSYVGDGVRKLLQRSLQDAPAGYDLEDAVRRNQEHYHRHLLDQTTAYPGVVETLTQLKPHYRLGVITNKPQAAAEKILAGLGILPLLDSLVGGGRTQRLKPDPEPLLLALRETNSVPADSWMIGDHRTDLGAARATGLHACFCAYGFGQQDGLPADAVIQSFPELIPLLIHN